jgi:hypothetical protein
VYLYDRKYDKTGAQQVVRNSINIYELSEIGNEKCYLGKEDEVWIWNRRMGHINFDILVKVNKKEAFREIP